MFRSIKTIHQPAQPNTLLSEWKPKLDERPLIERPREEKNAVRLWMCLLIAYCLPALLLAQSPQKVLKSLEKGAFDEAYTLIEQKLAKTPDDLAFIYLKANFFIIPENKGFYHIDSAYSQVLKAEGVLSQADSKSVAKWDKLGYNAELFGYIKEGIDSLAFGLADSLQTEISYTTFIERHISAKQRGEAITKRNALAFAAAKSVDTYPAYQDFLTRFPTAREAPDAQARFDLLLYQSKTASSSEADLAGFIDSFPRNPYRLEAEERLHKLFTADNALSTHWAFLKKYPNNAFTSRSIAWIWLLSNEKETMLQEVEALTNMSLVRSERAFQDNTLILAYDENSKLFGFMDQHGQVKIAHQYPNVREDYLCEAVPDPFVVVFDQAGKAGALNYFGETIAPFEFDQITSFIHGVLLTELAGRYGLFHSGGFPLFPPQYEALEPISSQLIKAKRNGKWGLISYNNQQVLPFEYQEITAGQGNVVGIRQETWYAFEHESTLTGVLKGQPLQLQFDFIRYEASHEGFLKLQSSQGWALKNVTNDQLVMTDAEEIKESKEGWVVKKGGGYALYDLSVNRITPVDYQAVIAGDRGYGVKIGGQWGGLSFAGEFFINPVYDTLVFIGNTGILVQRAGNHSGYFYQEDLTDFTQMKGIVVQSVSMADPNGEQVQVPFLVTTDAKGRKGLLSEKGKKILENKYQSINLLPGGVVAVELWGKKGLTDLEGRTVLPFQYDGFAAGEAQTVALLKNKLFGVYFPEQKSIIAPAYDALLRFYGSSDSLLIAKKGKFGIINRAGEEVAPFQFEEIRYWSPEAMLVKHEGRWKIYQIEGKHFTEEVFDSYERFSSEGEEQLILTYRSSGYGLLSNIRGRIIPEEYSEILNIGTAQHPFYRIERDFSKTQVHVVFFVDGEGKTVKRQLLNDTDYQKISCQ